MNTIPETLIPTPQVLPRMVKQFDLKEVHDGDEKLNVDEMLNPKELTELAESDVKVGNISQAILKLNHAIEKDPKCVPALSLRGNIYRMQQVFDKALGDFDTALKYATDKKEILGRRGDVYRSQKNYEKAFEDLNEAFSINGPPSACNCAIRAQAYVDIGEFDLAIKDLDEALEIAPNHWYALARRGDLYRVKMKYDEALKDLDKIIEDQPEYVWSIASRADVYYSTGKIELAKKEINRALKIEPNNDFALKIENKMV